MAVGADRRLPDRPRGADRSRRDRGDCVPVLIIDADAGSAMLDDNDAAVSADRGRSPRHELRRLLIVSRVRSIVVVDKDVRLGAVRTLIDDEVAVRTDGRRTVSESAARRRDRSRDTRLAVEQVDCPVGVVGHELPVGAHHWAEMVTAPRRNTGDWRRRYDERNCRRRNREYLRSRYIVAGNDNRDRT